MNFVEPAHAGKENDMPAEGSVHKILRNSVRNFIAIPRQILISPQQLAKTTSLGMLATSYRKVTNNSDIDIDIPATYKSLPNGGAGLSYLRLPATTECSQVNSDGLWCANWTKSSCDPTNQSFIDEVIKRIRVKHAHIQMLRLKLISCAGRSS